jgi:citrate synthase
MNQQIYVTAQEAATALGVSLPTLYAYVSRGLIRSEAQGKQRQHRYHLEDVQALKERRRHRRDPQQVAERALHWGTPIMDSALTLIDQGRLYYRGEDVVALARTQPFEAVVGLLWRGRLAPVSGPTVQLSDLQHGPLIRRLATLLLPVEAFQSLLPLLAAEDLAAYDLRPPATVQTGWRLLQVLAAVAVGQPGATAGIAQTLQQGWVPDDPTATACLNAALVLCADHELNVSSFTARCVASAGSTLYAVVSAGLAALQGPKHGGHTPRVEALFVEAGTPEGVRTTLAQRLRRGETVPGFGNLLYPEGDPRGAMLVQLACATHPTDPTVVLAQAIMDEVYAVIGDRPTIDFGLAMLAQALHLPPGGAMALFAIGRAAGWIGHAIEQYQHDHLIRPRARYVGSSPIHHRGEG